MRQSRKRLGIVVQRKGREQFVIGPLRPIRVIKRRVRRMPRHPIIEHQNVFSQPMERPEPADPLLQHGLRAGQKLRYQPRRARLPPPSPAKNVELILLKFFFRIVDGVLVQEVCSEEIVLSER